MRLRSMLLAVVVLSATGLAYVLTDEGFGRPERPERPAVFETIPQILYPPPARDANNVDEIASDMTPDIGEAVCGIDRNRADRPGLDIHEIGCDEVCHACLLHYDDGDPPRASRAEGQGPPLAAARRRVGEPICRRLRSGGRQNRRDRSSLRRCERPENGPTE